jgi:hypothetical protein
MKRCPSCRLPIDDCVRCTPAEVDAAAAKEAPPIRGVEEAIDRLKAEFPFFHPTPNAREKVGRLLLSGFTCEQVVALCAVFGHMGGR